MESNTHTLHPNHAKPSPTEGRELFGILASIALASAITLGGLYFLLPQADGTLPMPPIPQVPEASHGQPQQMAAMVERLAGRLTKEPNDARGWEMLARSYAALGRFADAAKAYGRADALQSANADLLADYADALAMARSGNFRGEPTKLIQRALKLAPNHGKALALAGTAAFRRQDYDNALLNWNKALTAIPPDSELAGSIRSGIQDIPGHRQRGAG